MPTRYKNLIFLAVSGVLTGLTVAFSRLGLAEWITLVPTCLFLLSSANREKPYSKRAMYGYGFFFFFCYYCIGFHWFVNLYPLDFIDGMTPVGAAVVVLAGCFGLSALQAFFGGFVFVFAQIIVRSRLARRSIVLSSVMLSGLWVVFEWSQNFFWWGVPFVRLFIGQSHYVLGLQTASLFGGGIVTFALCFVNFCIANIILNKKQIKAMAICICATLVFQYGVGAVIMFMPRESDRTVRVGVVQGNVSSSEKWSSEHFDRTLEIYEKYTLEAAEQGAEIIVWPESAIPAYVLENENLYRYCSELAEKTGVCLIVGAFSFGENGEDLNSLIPFGKDGEVGDVIYSKRRLVPFGEFVPLGDVFYKLIPPLAELVMLDDDLSPGDAPNVMSANGVSVGGLICFDSIYDYLSRGSVGDGAEFIALATNDSWFSDSAALDMHLAHAQLRAIETGRYVARAANTGISAFISSNGEVMCRLEILEEGCLVEDIHLNTGRTLYSLTGNVIVVFTLGLYVFAFVYERKHRCKKIIGREK